MRVTQDYLTLIRETLMRVTLRDSHESPSHDRKSCMFLKTLRVTLRDSLELHSHDRMRVTLIWESLRVVHVSQDSESHSDRQRLSNDCMRVTFMRVSQSLACLSRLPCFTCLSCLTSLAYFSHLSHVMSHINELCKRVTSHVTDSQVHTNHTHSLLFYHTTPLLNVSESRHV